MFMKLPPRFKVPTPLGGYNPDWAIFKIDRENGAEPDVTLVVETKSSHEIENCVQGETEDCLRPRPFWGD